ncbi:TPA: hypothetical protein HA246_02400 [Candidatus Woesearchaeota archaeon]|nr:hypothetical protein [Candidatus Woesearchaeota archaeon]
MVRAKKGVKRKISKSKAEVKIDSQSIGIGEAKTSSPNLTDIISSANDQKTSPQVSKFSYYSTYGALFVLILFVFGYAGFSVFQQTAGRGHDVLTAEEIDLAQYPNIFVKNDKFDAKVLVSEKSPSATLEAAAKIATNLQTMLSSLNKDCKNDNCPTDFNPGQEDDNKDGTGNACDNDAEEVNVDNVQPKCTDNDQDAYSVESGCSSELDCDDNDASIKPNTYEVCNNKDDNCNGQVDDGIDIQSDVNNCGACGTVCPKIANGIPECTAGKCVIGLCNTGFFNCDKIAENGCESAKKCCTDKDGDGSYLESICGGFIDCNDNDPMINRMVAEVCNGKDDDCNGVIDNGFNLQNDIFNCGSCGKKCASGQLCTNGQCGYYCTDNDGGKDYSKKGTISSSASFRGGMNSDRCESSDNGYSPILTEYFCMPDGTNGFELYDCTDESKLCLNDRCEEPTGTVTCSDKDGNDYSVAEETWLTVNDNMYVYEDKCTNNDELIEMTCDGNKIKKATHSCAAEGKTCAAKGFNRQGECVEPKKADGQSCRHNDECSSYTCVKEIYKANDPGVCRPNLNNEICANNDPGGFIQKGSQFAKVKLPPYQRSRVWEMYVEGVDKCANDRNLEYYTCTEQGQIGLISSRWESCPNGCKDAACVSDVLAPAAVFNGITGATISVGDSSNDPDNDGIPTVCALEIGSIMTSDKIGDPFVNDLIVIGSPCESSSAFSSAAHKLLGTPEPCDKGMEDGAGYIKVFNFNNHVEVLVTGKGENEVNKAAAVLAQSKLNNLAGINVKVTGEEGSYQIMNAAEEEKKETEQKEEKEPVVELPVQLSEPTTSLGLLSGKNIALLPNTGFNFETGEITQSLADADFFYNGAEFATGPPTNPGTNVFLVSLGSKDAKLIALGPNIDLSLIYQAPNQNSMPTQSSFPVYAINDGIAIYTARKTYGALKVTAITDKGMTFDYKYNTEPDDVTVGINPDTECIKNINKESCFANPKCFWDGFAFTCRSNTINTQPINTFPITYCQAFNVNLQDCSKLNKAICYSSDTSCLQASGFNAEKGVMCEDIDKNAIGAEELCNNIRLLSTCCSWTDGKCLIDATKTSCKTSNLPTSINPQSCADAGSDSGLCIKLKDLYIPCKFDDSSSAERIANPSCIFDAMLTLGHNAPFEISEIKTQAGCQGAGGKWTEYSYEKTDPVYGTKGFVTEYRCVASEAVEQVNPSLGKFVSNVDEDAFLVSKSNSKLTLNKKLTEITSEIGGYDLSALSGYKIKNDKETAVAEQKIKLGEGTVVFEENTDTDVVTDYLTFKDGKELLGYELKFEPSWQSDVVASSDEQYLKDMEGNSLWIGKKEYTVLTTKKVNEKGLKLTLLGGDVSDSIVEGETKTYSLNGKEYKITNSEVTDESINPNKVTFIVNGKEIRPLDKGEEASLDDGFIIGVKNRKWSESDDVINTDAEFCLRLATSAYCIISDKIEVDPPKTFIIDGKEFIINVKSIKGADTGESTNSIRKIQLEINGVKTRKLQVGMGDELEDGTLVGVRKIIPIVNGQTTEYIVEFSLDASKIELSDDDITNNLPDSSVIKINDENRGSAQLIITGSVENNLFGIDKISVNLKSDDNYWITAGQRLSEVVRNEPKLFLDAFGIDYFYAGLGFGESEPVYLTPSNEGYIITYTNKDGQAITDNLALISGTSITSSGREIKIDNDAKTLSIGDAVFRLNAEKTEIYPYQEGTTNPRLINIDNKEIIKEGLTQNGVFVRGTFVEGKKQEYRLALSSDIPPQVYVYVTAAKKIEEMHVIPPIDTKECTDSDSTYAINTPEGGTFNPPGEDRYTLGTVEDNGAVYYDYCMRSKKYTDDFGNIQTEFIKEETGDRVIEQACIDGKKHYEATATMCKCEKGACVKEKEEPKAECGNYVCEKGEDSAGCSWDCKVPSIRINPDKELYLKDSKVTIYVNVEGYDDELKPLDLEKINVYDPDGLFSSLQLTNNGGYCTEEGYDPNAKVLCVYKYSAEYDKFEVHGEYKIEVEKTENNDKASISSSTFNIIDLDLSKYLILEDIGSAKYDKIEINIEDVGKSYSAKYKDAEKKLQYGASVIENYDKEEFEKQLEQMTAYNDVFEMVKVEKIKGNTVYNVFLFFGQSYFWVHDDTLIAVAEMPLFDFATYDSEVQASEVKPGTGFDDVTAHVVKETGNNEERQESKEETAKVQDDKKPEKEYSEVLLRYLEKYPSTLEIGKKTFTLNLKEGMNLVSVPLVADDSKLESIFKNNLKDVETVYSYDSQSAAQSTSVPWKIWHADKNIPSDLEKIEPGKAYWVKAKTQFSVAIKGQLGIGEAQMPVSTKVTKGWNLVGVHSTKKQTINDAFANIKGKYNSLWQYKNNALDKIDINAKPDYMDYNYGDLIPGKGYWIYMSEEGEIVS